MQSWSLWASPRSSSSTVIAEDRTYSAVVGVLLLVLGGGPAEACSLVGAFVWVEEGLIIERRESRNFDERCDPVSHPSKHSRYQSSQIWTQTHTSLSRQTILGFPGER